MKKFLKPLALILAVTMLCQMLVISAVAETKSGNCGANATYSLNTETGVLTLDGTGATDNYDKFGEEGWTPTWNPGDPPPKVVPWKKNADSIKTVVVGEGITKIGNNAFSQCYNIQNIFFFSKDTQLSSSAFETSKGVYTIHLYRNSPADEYFSADEYTKVYLDGEIEDLFGDANSDGEIDITDVVLLAQYIAAWDVVIDEINSDCNMDNTINIKDVVLLAQYLAGWDVSLG